MEDSDHYGGVMDQHPLLLSSRKGGFRTIPFILATEGFMKLGTYGIKPNMIVYLMEEYHMEMMFGSNLLFLWSSAINFMPLLGAIAADSLVGRFTMISFGSILALLGMILLSLTTLIPQARPPECTSVSDNITCPPATFSQLLMLCSSLGLLSIGYGGIQSSCLAFGVDQLEKVVNQEEEDKDDHPRMLGNYISWHFALGTFSIFLASSFMVYIQENMGWEVGFGVAVIFMLISTLLFLVGSPFYLKLKAKSDLMLELVQVITAMFKKRHVKLHQSSSSSRQDHHHQNMYHHHINGSSLLLPSEKLRFLNRACVVTDSEKELTVDGRAKDPWSLCTVEQVEDFKALLRVIPLWSTGMIMAINTCQNSFPVLQALSMNRHIFQFQFQIPAASFGTFSNISTVLWVVLYHRAFLPMVSRIVGKQIHFSTRQRMGAGILVSCLSMAVSAAVETTRRNRANSLIKMSAMWLIPQYWLIGLSQGLNFVAQNEFYYSEFPKSMSSIASTLCALGNSVANLVASLLLSSFDSFSKRRRRRSGESWISGNVNNSHYDYYYWFLASISLFNYLYFLVCSKVYGPCRGDIKIGILNNHG